jgi:hypothetical protein
MNLHPTRGALIALLAIVALTISIFAYNITQSAGLPTIIIESDNSGIFTAVNATTGQTLVSSANQTYVQELTLNSLASTKAIIVMKENTWNHSLDIPKDLTVEENYQGKTSSYYNVQNINNNLTNIFGFATKTAQDTITYFYRQGTTHAQDKGDIVMRPYTISSAIWGDASIVYSDPILDCRNAAGGIIDDKIYLFFYRYNYATGSARGCDVGYIVSTDLTGSSWSTYTPLVNNTRASPYGTLVQDGQSSTWFLGYYAIIGNSSRIRLITTNDNGATWSVRSTVYNGTTFYSEPAIAFLGNHNLLVLARDDRNGPLHQFTSNDSGATWVDSGATNLGHNITNRANIPTIQLDGNNIHVLWADRGISKIMLSTSNVDTVFNDPLLYNVPNEIGFMENIRSINKGGYPSTVLLNDGELFYVYGNAIDKYTVDISSGIIKVS